MKNKLILLVLFALFQITEMVAQERTITGQVTSEEGMSLPGVNVVIQGTNLGTITDMDGNFSITVPENSTLVFSSLGFGTREIPIDNQSVINLVMTEDLEGLDEVVVTALGITREKKSLGYATQ